MIRSVEEARAWFLENPVGGVECEHRGATKIVGSFEEAEAFFGDGPTPTPFDQRMWRLVASFPSLADYAHPDRPFDPAVYKEFIDSEQLGRKWAARLVAQVFGDDDVDFNVAEAIKVWNTAHKTAFFRWCHSPFWRSEMGET